MKTSFIDEVIIHSTVLRFTYLPWTDFQIDAGNRHHIATHSLSSPITSETVPLKFPGNFQKFPKKLEALLLVAQLGTGNFYRF